MTDFSIERTPDFAEIFTHNRKKLPAKKTFVTVQDRTLTYGELFDLTGRLGAFFKKNGVGKGDRAVILSHDDMSVIVLFMACLRFGVTAVILNPEASEEEQKNLVAATKSKALFMDSDHFQGLGVSAPVTLAITPRADHRKPGLFGKKKDNAAFPQILYDFDPVMEYEAIPLETVAYILFTSGSTSRPKGVEITHGNLLAQMKTFVRHYGYGAESRLLDILPLHHTDGLTQGPVVAFTAGCTAHRPLRFNINRLPYLLDSIYRHRISHFIAVPSMLQLIDSMDKSANDAFKTSHFKFVISTAGYLDPHLWERFEKRFGIMVVNVYGLTETVCEALYCGPSPGSRRIGTIGKPVDTECRIVGEDGRDAAEGQSGELWVRGPHIMKGYFEMPQETAEVLTADGWFKTGDLCKRDADGFYHIVGRKKNIIIVGGMNIYPDDVANMLRSLPGVLDAAVWGESDPVWGEAVMAAVLPKPGVTLSPEKLGEAFLETGSLQMLPRHIHVVSEFPRGPAGKVIIRDLREQISGRKQAVSGADKTKNLDDQVLAVAAQAFRCPVESLTLHSTAETVKGWNSLAHVEFLLSIEKEFGIKIEPRDILSVRSIGDALKLVTDKKQKAA